MMLLMSTNVRISLDFCFAPSRRRIPKEAAPGGVQGEYMGMDDYGDEDEVDIPAPLFIFYLFLMFFLSLRLPPVVCMCCYPAQEKIAKWMKLFW